MKTITFKTFISNLVLGAFLSSLAQATPAGLTYQGRLVKNNLPVESSSVQLTLKVTSPGVNECVVYEETHTLNMTGSDGIFSVKIGAGTRTVNDKGFSLTQVFSNTGSTISSLTCTGGVTSYTSASTDSRNVYVSFNDGVDSVAFSSPYVIQSVPYAIEAERLAGKSSADFIQVTSDTTQTKLNDVMAPTPYTELLALINGTTTQYAKTGAASFTSDVNLNSHKITGVLAPTASTDATNKSYVDGYVGGKAADTATLTSLVVGDSGKVLSWNGTQWTATAPSSDATKLPLAGGTMAGPIAMGSNNITGLGYLSQNAGKYFQIGTFDNSAETTLSGVLLPAHQGATWYNTTSNELKFWTGTQVKNMSSSFANQTANQIFAGPGSGGAAAPAFRSLVEADIPQLTVASKVANSATTATSANTASAIVARDASGNFAASNITHSTSIFKDSGSNTVTLQAPTAVTTSYVLKLPTATVAGDAGKVLSTDATGQLSWIAAATGSVTSVGVTAPLASTGGASPTLSIATANTTTTGALSSTDWNTFNNKLGTTLSSGSLFVGNGSNVATGVAASGDAALSNTGAFTVTGIRGKSVSATLPTSSGQVLRYDGTSSYLPAFLTLADIRSSVTPGNTIFPATSCTAGQTMTWSSLTDTMTCSTIALADSQITYASQAANKFLASPSGASGVPTYRAIASVDLPTSGVSASTYNSVTVDTYGRVTAGTNPTTLSGYGITDAVKSGGQAGALTIGTSDATNLTLNTNNTAKMTILSNGNVGIGTTAPTQALSVNGNVQVESSSATIPIIFGKPTGGYGSIQIYGGQNNRQPALTLLGHDSYASGSAGQSGNGNAIVTFGSGYGVCSGSYTGCSAFIVNRYSSQTSTTELMRISDIGNVGIGTTNPATTLDVNGTSTFRGHLLLGADQSYNIGSTTQRVQGLYMSPTGNIYSQRISAGNSSFSVVGATSIVLQTNNANTNVFQGGYNQDTIVQPYSSSYNLQLAPSGGSVGIGTTSPSATLHSKSAGTDYATKAFKISDSAGTGLVTTTSDGRTYIGADTGSNANLVVTNPSGSSKAIAIFKDANNGSTPELDVITNSSNGIGLSVVGTTLPLSFGHTGNLNEQLVILGNGNVGIGTSAPAAKLDVNGSIAFASSGIVGPANLNITTDTSQEYYFGLSRNNQLAARFNGMKVYNNANGNGATPASRIGFFTDKTNAASSTQHMTITEDGYVGIGTTGPSYKLDVAGDINTSTCFRIGATTVSGTCTSDERLKENVQDYDAGLSDLLNIKLHTYTFNGLGEMPKTGEVAVGVIAQEVEKTNPELVKTRMVKMHPEDEEKTEIKVVDYSKFSFMLINAVKELYQKWFDDHGRIRSLETQVRSLAAENDALKSDNEALKSDTKAIKADNEAIKADNARLKAYLCQKDPKAPVCR